MQVQACSSMYVMLFEKDCVGLASRTGPIKAFVPPLVQMTSSENRDIISCCSLIPNVPVKMPPRPASGIVNLTVREALLDEYRKNPLVFTIRCSCDEQGNSISSFSRHFLGFGFSKDMPYFPPGTILQFVDDKKGTKEEATITGMAAAYGQRNHEYAIILSLDKPVHPDAISCFFMDSYNVTEIDGGDEGLCLCLANIIRKYTYTVGDVDPSCASTDAMQDAVSSKFLEEVQRMHAAVQMAISAMCTTAAGAAAYAEFMMTPSGTSETHSNCLSHDNNSTYQEEDSSSSSSAATGCCQEAEGSMDVEEESVQEKEGKDEKDREEVRRIQCIANAFGIYKETLFLQMRHQPLGTREWIQMFESYMSFAASQHGLGFIDFVLY